MASGEHFKNRTAENEAALAAFLEHDAMRGMYLYGAKNPELISPNNWKSDFGFMERPNARRVQLDLFYDYRTNVGLYSKWQAFLKTRQPKTVRQGGKRTPETKLAGPECPDPQQPRKFP
jgi:hypothetical protein